MGIVPVQVHIHAAAGVDHLLLGHTAGRLLFPALGGRGALALLFLGLGRRFLPGAALGGRRSAGLVPGAGLPVALVPPVLTGGAVLALLLGRGLGLRAAFGLVVGLAEHLFQILDLVILGQVVKDNGELPITEYRHMAGRGLGVLGQNLHDLLGAYCLAVDLKVLGQLVHSIFVLKTQISHLLQFHRKGVHCPGAVIASPSQTAAPS